MAEVKWQARRVSDGVLVDVTGDIEGLVLAAPYPNALDSGGGSGGVTVDNMVDAPVAVTSIVAPGATFDGAEATLSVVTVLADEDPGAIGANNIWIRTLDLAGQSGATFQMFVRDEADSGWYKVGISDDLDSGSVQVGVYTSDGDSQTVLGLSDTVASLQAYGVDGNVSGAVEVGDGGLELVASDGGVEMGFISLSDSFRLRIDGVTMIRAVDSGFMAFFGADPVARPQVPATPTEQDIVDALVLLGLVTQAAP